MKFILKSVAETHLFAAKFRDFLKIGDIICLHGNLGAGKTAFAQGLIKACNPEISEVVSPTFNLVQIYEGVGKFFAGEIWHFDFYRLKDFNEVYEIGLEEDLAYGISIIEWPEKISSFIPRKALHIYLSPSTNDANVREVEMDDELAKKIHLTPFP